MNVLKRWLPVAVWSAVILFASSDTFSAPNTGAALHTIFGIEWRLHVVLRKSMHLIGYGILGALAFRAARVDLRRPVRGALLIALLVAALDEGRQSLSSQRRGRVTDVLIDTLGAVIAISFFPAARASLSSRRGAE